MTVKRISYIGHRPEGLNGLPLSVFCALCSGFWVLLSVFCVLGSGFCIPSSAIAAPWDLENVIKEYLTDNYPWAAIEVNNIKVYGDIPEEAPRRIVIKKGPLGKAAFSLEFKGRRAITVTADVRALDWVVKSKRPFRKGHILQKDDVYLSLMDVKRMPRSAIRSPDEIIGKPLKRSVIADMPIVEGMLEKAPLVKRGQPVVLLIESRGLRITTLGMTKEKGYVGMPVKAINLSSRKEVSGILINENTVKVGF